MNQNQLSSLAGIILLIISGVLLATNNITIEIFISIISTAVVLLGTKKFNSLKKRN